MPIEAPLPKDHLMLVAWNNYKGTREYRKHREWAEYDDWLDGSLWAFFLWLVGSLVREQ